MMKMQLARTRGWYADQPLWVVFWVYGVALSVALILALFGPALSGKISLTHFAVSVVVLAVYSEWILVSIWRCADRVENKQWSTIARALTVAWAINLAMVLLFIAPDIVSLP